MGWNRCYARRLTRPESYVSKYESGERRLDVIEFVRVATVLKVAPEDLVKKNSPECPKKYSNPRSANLEGGEVINAEHGHKLSRVLEVRKCVVGTTVEKPKPLQKIEAYLLAETWKPPRDRTGPAR